MKHQDLLTEEEQEKQKLYLVHHMHHYLNNDEALHELHHCSLFSKPDMQGEKYSLEHLISEGKLYHVLNKKPENVLYDHANNSFEIKEIEINHKNYYILS